MKTTKLVILTGITMLLCAAGLRAQVKIGDRPLEIRDNRLLELQSGVGDGVGEFFFIKDYDLADSTGMTIGRASNNNDPLMIKLFGYGQGPSLFQAGAPGIGARGYFLGTNANGEMLEFPLALDLGSDGTLSLNDGDATFGAVQLDTVFATNTQLLDSLTNIRVLVADSDSRDGDTVTGNEYIDAVTFNGFSDSLPNLLTIADPGNTYIVNLDLGLATDDQLADTAQVLRDFNFYLNNNTFDDATRTASGGGVTNLTFDDLSQFNVTNTPIINLNATTGNATVSSDDADVVITGNGTTGTVDVDANAIDIDGASTVDLTAVTRMDVNGADVDVDATDSLLLTGASNATLESSGGNVVVNATSGTGVVDINGTDVDIDASDEITLDGNLIDATAATNVNITAGDTVNIDANDNVSLDGNFQLDDYGQGTKTGSETYLIGVDASGNILDVSLDSIGGDATLSSPVDLDENGMVENTVDAAIQAANREIDSTIYNYNGTLTDERFMTMDSHTLHFLGDNGDTTVIDENGRIAIGRSTVTPHQMSGRHIMLDVNGDIYAQQVHSSSDRRFKKNIKVVDNALEKIMQIEGVTYDWRREEFPGRNFPDVEQLGFIAQNIEEVAPQVVMTAADGYKAVDYAKVTALLTEAIKEQQKLIDKQKEIITAQGVQISKHSDDMTTLASAIASLRAELDQMKEPPTRTTDE